MRQIALWLRGLVFGLFGCLGPWSSGATDAFDAEAWRVVQAEVRVQLDGQPVEPSRKVRLPYIWDKAHPGRSGSAVFVVEWDGRLQAPLAQGIYLPHMGNRFELRLNGQRLTQESTLRRAGSDGAKVPHWVSVPAPLLADHNRLEIEIEADPMRKAGLGTVWIGSERRLWPTYDRAWSRRVGGALAVVVFSLAVGTLALGLWWAQWRGGSRDDLFLVAGLTEWLWCVRVADPLIPQPPLSWPLWGAVVSVSYALWIAGALLFVHKAAQLPTRHALAVGWWVAGSALVCTVLTSTTLWPMAWTVWGGLTAVLMLLYVTGFLWVSWRHPTVERLLIALVALINVLVGARDWYQVKVADRLDGGHAWISYTSVLFGAALAVLVVRRFRNKVQEVQTLNTTLDQRVMQKEAELRAAFGRQQAWLLEQERQQARTQLLRDMHDGVGSHLGSAIRQIESGRGSPQEVLQTLRDTLDQLKLSVDGLGLEPGDLAGLLASLRFRLEPRLRGAGIVLVWQVDPDLPSQPHLDLQALQHLRYMVFEMISNVQQHAQATRVWIEASQEAGQLVLACSDNGVGFDAKVSGGRGLRYMRERAQQIGAQLVVQAQPDGSRIELRWPVPPTDPNSALHPS